MNPLVTPARHALTDMLGLFHLNLITVVHAQTIVDLYNGLIEVHEDVSDYHRDVQSVLNWLDEESRGSHKRKYPLPRRSGRLLDHH